MAPCVWHGSADCFFRGHCFLEGLLRVLVKKICSLNGPKLLGLDMAFVSPARYPLAISDHVPTDRPTAHKLMGKELVVWRDGQGEWSVMEDSCPHR